jgi:hypothetical protein
MSAKKDRIIEQVFMTDLFSPFKQLVCRFYWTKNGKRFDLNADQDRITKVPGEGSFFFGRLSKKDEGVYRCHAKNGNGTAVDQDIQFNMTCKICEMRKFSLTTVQGQPVFLRPNQQLFTLSWARHTSTVVHRHIQSPNRVFGGYSNRKRTEPVSILVLIPSTRRTLAPI